MVESVDTRDLKSLGFTPVRVRVPLPAPVMHPVESELFFDTGSDPAGFLYAKNLYFQWFCEIISTVGNETPQK